MTVHFEIVTQPSDIPLTTERACSAQPVPANLSLKYMGAAGRRGGQERNAVTVSWLRIQNKGTKLGAHRSLRSGWGSLYFFILKLLQPVLAVPMTFHDIQWGIGFHGSDMATRRTFMALPWTFEALPWVCMALVAVVCYENVHGIAMEKSHDIVNGATIVLP